MPDLIFEVRASAGGPELERQGRLSLDGQDIRYSAPAGLGGIGLGESPETLLLSAVAACYSLTLAAVLAKRGLPNAGVAIRAEGRVTGLPGADRFERVLVHPQILGYDESRFSDYMLAARRAHERCFIGQTIASGSLGFELGSVNLSEPTTRSSGGVE